MGYARVRPEICANHGVSWTAVLLKDLEGNELYWTPNSEWVESVCFDGMQSGLYVLTDDGGDSYFTCHSADLEFSDTLPTKPKETKMGKHALPYNPHRDIDEHNQSRLVVELGQDLDTWQLIARDLARDITRNDDAKDDSWSFAYDILNRLSHMPEMNIHPSEVRPKA